jgi:hypothetical protein
MRGVLLLLSVEVWVSLRCAIQRRNFTHLHLDELLAGGVEVLVSVDCVLRLQPVLKEGLAGAPLS